MVSNSNISSIVFDLGGVILNIDPKRTIDQFRELGFNDIEQFLDHYRSKGFLAEFQSGKLNEQDFMEVIRGNIEIAVTEEQIRTAWNAMLLDYPINRIEKLQSLKKQYHLYLLSNTNIIHCQSFAGRVPGVEDISELFDAVYYSHEIGLSKPSEESFLYVLEANNLNPNQVLFLDDLPENIDSAKQLRMHTYLVKCADDWPNEIDNILDFSCMD